MVATRGVCFRMSEHTLKKLDSIVGWENTKGPTFYYRPIANRTSVLVALILRENLRLDDEAAKLAEKVAKVKKDARAVLESPLQPPEGAAKRQSPVRAKRARQEAAKAG